MLKIVKRLNERQALLWQDDRYFVVSESIPLMVPKETLVFESDNEGKILNWMEVGGEIGIGVDDYLSKIEEAGEILTPWKDNDLPW